MIDTIFESYKNPPLKIQAYYAAYLKCSDHDKANLNKAVKRLTQIKNMGGQSAFELLAEIGMTITGDKR